MLEVASTLMLVLLNGSPGAVVDVRKVVGEPPPPNDVAFAVIQLMLLEKTYFLWTMLLGTAVRDNR